MSDVAWAWVTVAVIVLALAGGEYIQRHSVAAAAPARCEQQFNEMNGLATKCLDKLAACISLLPEDRR